MQDAHPRKPGIRNRELSEIDAHFYEIWLSWGFWQISCSFKQGWKDGNKKCRSCASMLVWQSTWPCYTSHFMAGRAVSVTRWQPLQSWDATWKFSLHMRYTFAAAVHTQGGTIVCSFPWTVCYFLMLCFVLGNICCF